MKNLFFVVAVTLAMLILSQAQAVWPGLVIPSDWEDRALELEKEDAALPQKFDWRDTSSVLRFPYGSRGVCVCEPSIEEVIEESN